MAVDAPSLEDAAAALRGAEREQSFWAKHYGDLAKRYPQQFVAVRDGAVVAARADLRDLERAVAERGLTLQDVWVR